MSSDGFFSVKNCRTSHFFVWQALLSSEIENWISSAAQSQSDHIWLADCIFQMMWGRGRLDCDCPTFFCWFWAHKALIKVEIFYLPKHKQQKRSIFVFICHWGLGELWLLELIVGVVTLSWLFGMIYHTFYHLQVQHKRVEDIFWGIGCSSGKSRHTSF